MMQQQQHQLQGAPSTDEITEDDLQIIYNWVDEIPLSRPKRNIARDFSDGVLLAEIVKHYLPKLVDMHNYSQAHSVSQKTYNWNTLNVKVLKKLGLSLSKKEIEQIVNMEPDSIEKVLLALRFHVDQYMNNRRSQRQFDPRHRGANDENNAQYSNMQQQPMMSQKQSHGGQPMINHEVLVEKDHTINQMKETIEILELKIKKLEQLVKLKDSKIANLSGKLQSMGIMQ